MKWKGKIKPNTVSHQVGHVMDIVPTCLEATQSENPANIGDRTLLPLEGESLLPVLQDKTPVQDRELFWFMYGNRAVRQGKWKLVSLKNKPWELYDMENDRTEMNDLASQHPDKVRVLEALYEQWSACVFEEKTWKGR